MGNKPIFYYSEVIKMLDFIPNQKIIRVNRENVDKVAAQGRRYLIAY